VPLNALQCHLNSEGGRVPRVPAFWNLGLGFSALFSPISNFSVFAFVNPFERLAPFETFPV
jgi:hypothetical protein